MFWLGIIILAACIWAGRRQPTSKDNSKKSEKSFLDWLLTGGLAVFVLLVFRVGWVQALLRVQYWVWALLPFLRPDNTTAQPASAADSAQMSRAEAARILGIDESASEIEVQKAYKTLMLKLHPDKGGNSYLAGKLNEARDCLLG